MSSFESKVERVIATYDLGDLGRDLETAWTGHAEERTSLRDLAARFNRAVLAAALDDTTALQTDREIERLYEDLVGDSASDAVAARREIERHGIDVDAVEADFVTHQTIHTYLTKVRNATLPTDDRDQTEQRITTIENLQGRLNSVIDTSLTTLANGDELNHDSYEVLVDIQLLCPHCGASTPLKELLRAGGCACENR
jgi:hypothetical protein